MSAVKHTPGPWEAGKCRVPMWSMGLPAGFCGSVAYGHQLPHAILAARSPRYLLDHPPYCHGHCCPSHGGPTADEPRFFTDGYTEQGRPMWCAVPPDFVNLQESIAGFDGNPIIALANLRIAQADARGDA